jgi:hypothetical protein
MQQGLTEAESIKIGFILFAIISAIILIFIFPAILFWAFILLGIIYFISVLLY